MRRSFLLASAPLLLLPACADLGERAQDGCPDGETCSPLTPFGLEFQGPQFGDDGLFQDVGVKVTAVGGTQTVSAFDHHTGDPLQLAYRATVDGDALAVDGTFGNEIDVRGASTGSGLLELRDPAGDLFDRLEIASRPIVAARIVAPDGGELLADLDTPPPLALFDGGTDVRFGVALLDGRGNRLIDDSMRLTSSDAPVAQVSWDVVEVASVGGGVTLDVTAGGVADAPLAVDAFRPDRIVGRWWIDVDPPDTSLPVPSSNILCFHAMHESSELLGAPWTFAVEGPAYLSEDAPPWRNCVVVVTTAVGHVTVRSTAPGARGAFEFDAVPSAKPKARPVHRVGLPTPGERAGTVR